MAQSLPAMLKGPTPMLVASISDSLAGQKGQSPVQAWFGTPVAKGPVQFCEGARSSMLTTAEAESSCQQAPSPSLDTPAFHLRARRTGLTHQAARQLNAAMTSLSIHHHGVQHDFFSFFNHHVLPLLAHVAIVQHHAVLNFSERMRSIRLRNPFRKGHRSEQQGESCMHHTTGPRPPRHAHKLYEQARSLERALNPVAAAEAFLAAVEADPRQAEWLTLAAKQWSDASYLDGLDPVLAAEYNRKAIELSSKALDMAPTAAHGYIARCVSRGRLALLCDNRTKVTLAREACDDAEKALALEPNNDYAHHLMARWHYEMAGLNAITRTLVRLIYGQALMSGSYVAAAHHYRTASQISPRTLVHRAELGRTLQRLGKTEEAVAELRACLECDVDDLNAHLTKVEVEKLLESMTSNARTKLFYAPPLPPPPTPGPAVTAPTGPQDRPTA